MQTTAPDPRREWLRTGAIGGCVAIAAIVLWPVSGGSALASAGAATRGRAQQAVEQQRRQVDRQVEWIVTDAHALQLADTTHACLTAGAACSSDAMLDVDTTRMRSAALAAELAATLDPKAKDYPGPSTTIGTALARRTSESATVVATTLGQWLAMGCGSNVDGVPVTTHPDGCDDLARTAARAMDDLAMALRSWPAP